VVSGGEISSMTDLFILALISALKLTDIISRLLKSTVLIK